MENINMKLVVVVVCLAVCIGATWGNVHDSAKANEEKAREAATQTVNAAKDSAESSSNSDKDAAAPAVDAAAPGAATEKSETFGQWAYEKITGVVTVVSETANTPEPATVKPPSSEESSASSTQVDPTVTSGGMRIGVSGTWVVPLVLVLGVVFVGFLDM